MAKNKQLEAEFTQDNMLVLIESRTMRDQHVYREEVLEKVKGVAFLTDNFEVTIQMAADYYEVPFETIKGVIRRHREEFNEYGEMRLLKGKLLKDFKAQVQDVPNLESAPSLTLINRRGLLRIGMLLTDSEVAQAVRNYLLNIEEVSDDEQKRWAIEREISKRDRRQLTDAIQEFYDGALKNGVQYAAFTNLVYDTLFDMTANELKVMYELEKREALRDSFTTEDLRKVVKVEKTISVLLLLGKSYEEIVSELQTNKAKYQ
ncbi:hypothetical protein P9Y62_04180 [Bacillus thuringiensis]|uniref:hypothetical protein n=1 Tax=Bacillus thuringiensis TaxID=1428 RepID=UPI0001A1BBDB|nr:hypothetical protein [Bacillus thuringiensis]EEM37929.1 hypothetical protein bthur0004_62280 [Bacillus thuringiensis serovar sotto str. T04001]MEB4891190.1 hypothetical protein [Bacillus thuringiensis]MEC2564737.1 hypothetical protein [Bacillus thuringiensis]MEC2646346.1 hypothetical protein [Bacillus thuringiensis]MEC2723200.1 hypothetical protein [Bacillus thuringiensis]